MTDNKCVGSAYVTQEELNYSLTSLKLESDRHAYEIEKLKRFKRMFWVWMLLVSIALIFVPFICKAETAFRPIVIDIVYIKNDYGLVPTDRCRFEKEMLKFLERLPINFSITRRTANDNPACAAERFVVSTGDVYQSFDCYKRFQSKKPGHFTLIVAPPVFINGREVTGGISNGVCEQNSIGIVYANSVNSDNQARNGHSALAAAHEAGHGAGCQHTDEDNHFSVMHPAALAYYYNRLRFILQSRVDVGFCVSSVWNRSFTKFHKVEMLHD